MPVSRSRKSRNRSRRQRQRQRRRGAEPHEETISLDPRRFSEQLESILTDDDHREMERSADAEAAGDPVRALQHLLNTTRVVGSLHEHHLRELVALGDDMPGWGLARWVRVQAYRWMLLTQDPRVDDVALTTFICAYPDLDIESPMGLAPGEFLTRLAASDWICEQVALYEYGGLADFLDVRAADSLVDRSDQIASWCTAPMGGYTLDAVSADRLLVTDLADGQGMETLNLGALTDRDRGVAVLGRVVTMSVAPGRMFDARPVEVDPETARATAVSVAGGHQMGWIDAVYAGRREGRLPRLFSTGGGTPLTSDIVPLAPGSGPYEESEPLTERMRELVESGLSFVAANGVEVCEVGLIAAEVTGDGAAVGPHVAAVLSDPAVFAAARRHCTDPRHERSWQVLAASVPEPARSRCLELAATCRVAA